MHIPSDYEIKDKAIIAAFMQQYPFAQVVCAGDTFPIVNHMPLLYDAEQHCLWGHLAKNNPDLNQLTNSRITVVFSGTHGYISPDWYEKTGVPTWNYQAVHVTGTCHIDTSEKITQKIVDELSELHQKSLGLSWVNDYNPAMLSAIVALKIDIHDMRCQFKLSQDRSAIDRKNVIIALQENGQPELAEAMKQAFKL
ncbi:MAG: FMN-binding negative transcriptional regulator [Proteobacteria bacterium]|nr:MAG: FMN-binding negative transcriptional regulator [Pseudomonadota bacterium]